MDKKMKFRGVLVILLLSGCTSFDASDLGDTKEVLLGKEFRISLPGSSGERIPQVEKIDIARFERIQRDTSSGMDTFEFRAIGVGETRIKIPAASSSPLPEYAITIKVLLGGSPPY
jgi:hypothetical protein